MSIIDKALVLNGYFLAEESVLYLALGKIGEKGAVAVACGEQTTAKMQMDEFERIDPAAQDWFLDLTKKYDDQDQLTVRFREECERYDREVGCVNL